MIYKVPYEYCIAECYKRKIEIPVEKLYAINAARVAHWTWFYTAVTVSHNLSSGGIRICLKASQQDSIRALRARLLQSTQSS